MFQRIFAIIYRVFIKYDNYRIYIVVIEQFSSWLLTSCLFVAQTHQFLGIHLFDNQLLVRLPNNNAPCHNGIHVTVTYYLLKWKWFMFNPWLFLAAKLIFVAGSACVLARWERRADESWWFGGNFEKALVIFANIAIFKSNYLSCFTQTLDCYLNLLYVHLN